MKAIYVGIGSTVILALIIFFSVSGIQTVSTEKTTYSVGEKVTVHWTTIKLEWCSSANNKISIFKKDTTGWTRIRNRVYSFGDTLCVNGELFNAGMPADVHECFYPKSLFAKGVEVWNSQSFTHTGTVDSCVNPFNNETNNFTRDSYELKNVPPGTYKIQFENTHKIIEIQ